VVEVLDGQLDRDEAVAIARLDHAGDAHDLFDAFDGDHHVVIDSYHLANPRFPAAPVVVATAGRPGRGRPAALGAGGARRVLSSGGARGVLGPGGACHVFRRGGALRVLGGGGGIVAGRVVLCRIVDSDGGRDISTGGFR